MREPVPALVENLRLVVEPKSEALMQSIELEETQPPMVLTTLIGLICGLVVSFLLWSALTKVEELTRSQGAVMPAGDVIALRHLEGGLVSEILVEEGQEVAKGQPLLRLAPISTEARLDQLRERQASVKLSIERHEALVENRAPNFESVIPAFADQKNEQFMLYTAQFELNDKRRSVLQSQFDQQLSEQKRLENQISALEKSAELVFEEARLRKKLFDDGLTTRDRYYAAQREAQDLEKQLADYRDQLAASEIQILEAAKKIEELDSQTQSDLRQAKADLDLELAEVEQGLADFGGRSERLTMTAPASGVVKGLAVNAVNAVVQAGETVMEIVPVAERMVVSAQVSPAEVSRVQPGQAASVRVAAYDSSSYGSLDGVVELVSASTFQDERGETFYRAIISLEKAHFGEDPARNRILPGMSVQADIKTGSKSILGYLLKPVSRGWSNAFHER